MGFTQLLYTKSCNNYNKQGWTLYLVLNIIIMVCQIDVLGDVYIHPSAVVHPTAVVRFLQCIDYNQWHTVCVENYAAVAFAHIAGLSY